MTGVMRLVGAVQKAGMPKRTTGNYARTTVAGEEVAAFIPLPLPPANPPIVMSAQLAEQLRAAEQALVRLELAGELAQAIRYYKNHRAALLRFVDDPDLPIDNSPTERLFQNVTKLRLNMLFAGSTEGARRACVLLGITATCRAIGVPPLAYLTWAFERLGTHRDLYGLQNADLTPAAFKRAR